MNSSLLAATDGTRQVHKTADTKTKASWRTEEQPDRRAMMGKIYATGAESGRKQEVGQARQTEE